MTCYYLNGERQPCRYFRCQVEEEQRRKAEEAQKQASDKDFGKRPGLPVYKENFGRKA